MARGFVWKRGDIWYAYWRDLEGKQRCKAVGTRKKRAEAFLAKVQAELHDGVYKNIVPITFPEFAETWLQEYVRTQVKPSTLHSYTQIVNGQLIPFFGAIPLTALTASDIQRLVSDGLDKGRAPSTVKKTLVILKGMLNQAVEWDYLKVNPALVVKPPRSRHIEMDALSPSEVQLLLAQFDDQWYALFFAAIFTGMRLGELLALQWSDIDWASSTIRVRRSVWGGQFQEPKTKNSRRAIVMTPRLVEVLRTHQGAALWNELDLVFCNESGGIIDGANLRHRVFEPALVKAGLRKVRIHDLRHTYASLLINQGENLKYIQNQLGHASITTTVDKYGHLIPEMNMGAASRLDATVFGA